MRNVYKILEYEMLMPGFYDLHVELVDRYFNKLFYRYNKVTSIVDFEEECCIFQIFGDGVIEFVNSKEVEALFLYAEKRKQYENYKKS